MKKWMAVIMLLVFAGSVMGFTFAPCGDPVTKPAACCACPHDSQMAMSCCCGSHAPASSASQPAVTSTPAAQSILGLPAEAPLSMIPAAALLAVRLPGIERSHYLTPRLFLLTGGFLS